MPSDNDPKVCDGVGEVLVGPDLNPSRSPLDKKLYRQILLPNGLRAVLISDTLAMQQQVHTPGEKYGHLYDDDDDDDDDDDGTEEDGSASEGGGADDGDRIDEEDASVNSHDHQSQTSTGATSEEGGGIRMAASALLVGVGSYSDPQPVQGLAHFLEHMLFMGTEKYPTENAYDHFLSSRGGSDNAYTDCENTVYHLEIPQEDLFEALDMFAQFFVSPLLKPDSVERELESIESEFQLSRNSDGSRVEQLLCHTCGKEGAGHPFGKFSWGNRYSLVDVPDKLGVDKMVELRKFYDQHYYASNMRLVLIGAYTLDELQEHVVQCFSGVPAEPRVPSPLQMVRHNPMTWEEMVTSPIADCGMPFDPKSSLGRLYRVVPVKDRHGLSITWQLPPQHQNWRSKPCDYLGHLIGHESAGSLLSSLKAKSWAIACSAGVGEENASSHALFSVNLTLSEQGVPHWPEIVSEMYTYIGMVRHYCSTDEGLPSWIYEEIRAVDELAYKFGDERPPEELVEELVEDMAPGRSLPPERLLDGSSLLFVFDPDLVRDLVDNYLTPENARLDLMSSTFGRAADYEEKKEDFPTLDNDLPPDVATSSTAHHDNSGDAQDFSAENCNEESVQTEPYFGTKYWCHRISQELLDKWKVHSMPSLPPPKSLLSLPPVNPFVPKKFDLKPLPPSDAHHPLLHCSLKLCVSIGKKKEWFPATVTKYNSTNNLLLLAYEDEDEKWHQADLTLAEAASIAHKPNFEGTMDKKSIKFKVVSVPKDGQGAVLKFGDVTDFHVDIGVTFPPIPAPLPKSRLPQLVVNTQSLKLWHLQDRKFRRPIAELRLKIVCGNANKTPLHRACADLFATLCRDALTETSYQAEICELGKSIAVTDIGFTIRVHGFDDKLLELVREILGVFFSFRCTNRLPDTVKPGRFDACLEMLLRKYANAGMTASSLCTDVRLRCLRTTIWSSSSKLDALKEITQEGLAVTMSTILDKMSIECLYHGNCERADAKLAGKLIMEAFGDSDSVMPKKKHSLQPVLKVPLSVDDHIVVAPTKDPKEPNTAVEVYFQVGKDDITERVLLDLLCQVIHEPLFDILRTKEQFGYDVYCSPRWTYGVTGMSFKVVTASKSALEVTERLEKFILDFRDELVNMNNTSFSEHLTGLAKNKLQMFNSLEEECNMLWSEIVDCRYDWEVHRNEAVHLRDITKSRLLAAYDDWFLPQCSAGKVRERRRLVVHVIGTSDGPASLGRPSISSDLLGTEVDMRIQAYHKVTGHATWGKIM